MHTKRYISSVIFLVDLLSQLIDLPNFLSKWNLAYF